MTQVATLNNTLEFGLFDWIEWDKSAPSEIFENRLRMLEYADRSGFYSYHLAEHHITPLSVSPSPAVFLAAAAQRTSRICAWARWYFCCPSTTPSASTTRSACWTTSATAAWTWA